MSMVCFYAKIWGELANFTEKIHVFFLMGKLIYSWLYKPNLCVEDTDNWDCVLTNMYRNRNGQNTINFFEEENQKEIKNVLHIH